MSKKQQVEEYYVQLGKRVNGKIVKAENYGLLEFCELILPAKKMIPEVKISWYDRVFNTVKYKKYLNHMLYDCAATGRFFERMVVMFTMKGLISRDDAGKKPRKKVVKKIARKVK